MLTISLHTILVSNEIIILLGLIIRSFFGISKSFAKQAPQLFESSNKKTRTYSKLFEFNCNKPNFSLVKKNTLHNFVRLILRSCHQVSEDSLK
jgi:hypothetical protein